MFEFRISKEFKNKKIRLLFKEDIEPEEVLLDSLAKKKEEELGISEKKFEVPLSRKILLFLYFLCFGLIFFLFFKTYQLQIIEGGNFKALAESNKFKIFQIQAERGVIYDQNFKQLVFNRLSFDLICDKTKLPQSEKEKDKIILQLAYLLRKDFSDLKKEIEENNLTQVLISENLDYLTLILLEAQIEELSGFQIQKKTIREYLDSPNFSHLIGYTGKITAEELRASPEFYSIFDSVGRDGLEKFYEEILRKNPGKLRIERDALGNIISKKVISLPESGKSLVLWLDSELQKKIKEELEKKIKEVGAKGGAVVALNPKRGGVLAMVSWPTFDNNLFSQGITQEEWQKLSQEISKPLLNRVLSGQYLVGSTIKPLIASAALEEKIISPNKEINCQGFIEIPHRYQPGETTRKEDWTVHGWTDLRKAIAESCNVYFYTVGGGYGEEDGLGPTKIKKYLELFGWGQLSQIDLPIPEWATGLVPDPEWKRNYFKDPREKYWWDGDTYNLSIGQGYILATPLQVATAFSAIANGGKLYQPQVVKKIVDREKNLIEEIQPKIIRENFIDPQNLQIVREGMRWAVTGQNSPHASAVLLNSLPVSSAAKTGTAEVSRKGCQDCYHIWITVFAPYEDPKIVLTIVLEDVKGLRSQIVVPLAKEILNWYFSRP